MIWKNRYLKVLLVSGLNNAKYDKSSIKSYLLLIFINHQFTEPVDIEKFSHYVFQCLVISKF